MYLACVHKINDMFWIMCVYRCALLSSYSIIAWHQHIDIKLGFNTEYFARWERNTKLTYDYACHKHIVNLAILSAIDIDYKCVVSLVNSVYNRLRVHITLEYTKFWMIKVYGMLRILHATKYKYNMDIY